MSDGSSKQLKNIKIRDKIIGVKKQGRLNYYVNSVVLNHWKTKRNGYKIIMNDGTEVICSSNHKWLSNRGWKYTTGMEWGKLRRPHLTSNNYIMGSGNLINLLPETEDYMRGYLCGIIKGDGTVKKYDYSGKRRKTEILYQFRLALIDQCAVERTYRYLKIFGVNTNWFKFDMNGIKCDSIRINSKKNYLKIKELIKIYSEENYEFSRGYLAGIFDAEGNWSNNILRIPNTNEQILSKIKSSLNIIGIKYTKDKPIFRPNRLKLDNIRIINGMGQVINFFQIVNPSIKRKFDLVGKQVKGFKDEKKIVDIISLNREFVMYDITTSTETFIANGMISHNCYAKERALRVGYCNQNSWVNPKIRKKDVKKKRRKLDGTIMFPTTHDITPNNIEQTMVILAKLLLAGNNLLIVSKPNLECIKKICATFENFENQILFRFTIGSANDKVLSFWEPNAPTFSERLLALKHAYYAGFKTSISSEPMLDNCIDKVVDKAGPFATDSIWIGKMNNCMTRVKRNTDNNPEIINELKILMKWQDSNDNIMKLYHRYKDNSKIKWKESIKKIVGIKIPTEAGLDV